MVMHFLPLLKFKYDGKFLVSILISEDFSQHLLEQRFYLHDMYELFNRNADVVCFCLTVMNFFFVLFCA